MKLAIKPLLCFLLTTFATLQAEVTTVEWNTKHAAPPFEIAKIDPKLSPLIKLAAIREPFFIKFLAFGGTQLGVNNDQAARLHQSITAYYRMMAIENKAKEFPKIPSTLSYCFSTERPSKGLATVYYPDTLTSDTPTIVFLHGYGGSYQFYLHYLATTFPKHIIICPAFGISTAKINDSYLIECQKAVAKKLNTKLNKTTLIGLSAGGTGVFNILERKPLAYDRFIALASLPPAKIGAVPTKTPVRTIAGGDEHFVKKGTLKARIKKLKLHNYQETILPNQGHFFLLTDQKNTRLALQKAISN